MGRCFGYMIANFIFTKRCVNKVVVKKMASKMTKTKTHSTMICRVCCCIWSTTFSVYAQVLRVLSLYFAAGNQLGTTFLSQRHQFDTFQR